MRLLVAGVLTSGLLLGLSSGASGRETFREFLVFKNVGVGEGKRVLSGHNVAPESSSLSPDRRQFAYAPYVYDGTKSKELWIANVNRPGERRILQTRGFIFSVVWAPTG